MKILIIVDDYIPGSTKIAAIMMHSLAKELVHSGHHVRIITPDVDLPGRFKIENIDQVSIMRFKSGKIKNINRVRRAINETLLSLSAWRSLRKQLKSDPANLIIWYSPSIFWAPFVKWLKRIWSSNTYLILRDIFPQWAVDAKLLREKSLFTMYFRFFEKQNYRIADKIGLMSQANLEWFQNKFGSRSAEVLYNWHSEKVVKPNGKFRKRYSLEKKVIFFYGGNLGVAQQIENLLDLALAMRNQKQVVFVFIGKGDSVPLINEYITRNSLDNCILLPAVSQEEYARILGEADVGLFSLHRDHQTHNFPGKIMGYLNYGLPVLGCVNPGNDVREVINNHGAGLISISGDVKALLNNAKLMLKASSRQKMAVAGKKLLKEKFSVRAAARQIAGMI